MTDKTTKQKRSEATVSIKLNESELNRMKNEASRSGFADDWKAYATKQFREKVTNSLVGGPTVGIGSKGLITGPSKPINRSDYVQ